MKLGGAGGVGSQEATDPFSPHSAPQLLQLRSLLTELRVQLTELGIQVAEQGGHGRELGLLSEGGGWSEGEPWETEEGATCSLSKDSISSEISCLSLFSSCQERRRGQGVAMG
jgi:hypothetical protein